MPVSPFISSESRVSQSAGRGAEYSSPEAAENIPQEIPAIPQEIPAMPQEIPAMPQEIPAMPQEISAMPQEMSSQMMGLLSQNELTLIFMRSCSCKNMCVHLTRRLFSEKVRMTSNVSGRKKRQLDPKIISYIKATAFRYFPTLYSDITKEWAECIVAIDESCRRLKNKPTKKQTEAMV